MRFSEYLIYEGLRQNNRALYALGQRQDPLSDSAVHELRLVVKRLRAYWLVLVGAVSTPEYRAARLRLRNVHRALACARDRVAIGETLDGLAAKAPSDKVLAALQLCAQRLNEQGPETVAMMVPRDLVARGFQEESQAWRDLAPGSITDPVLLKGYRHSYRVGRRLGLRALETQAIPDLHRWRGSVRVCQEQLELIRPVLGEEAAQTRFHLGRLNDTLGQHHDLAMVRSTLATLDLPEKQRQRVGGLVELRMRYARERAAKLYPLCYRFAPKRYAAGLERDLNSLDFVTLVAARERAVA